MRNNGKKKFIVLIFAAGMSLGLLFTTASFIFWRKKDNKLSLFYFTAAQAKLISSNVKCSLSFADRTDANNVLSSLKTQNFIAFAGVYDANNNLFAYYCRDDIKRQGFVPTSPSKAKLANRDGYMVISEPVIVEHALVGTVCLWAKP